MVIYLDCLQGSVCHLILLSFALIIYFSNWYNITVLHVNFVLFLQGFTPDARRVVSLLCFL